MCRKQKKSAKISRAALRTFWRLSSFLHPKQKFGVIHARLFCSEDFVSSYFVAFSNDSRDWTTLHDGYAEWVSDM